MFGSGPPWLFTRVEGDSFPLNCRWTESWLVATAIVEWSHAEEANASLEQLWTSSKECNKCIHHFIRKEHPDVKKQLDEWLNGGAFGQDLEDFLC